MIRKKQLGKNNVLKIEKKHKCNIFYYLLLLIVNYTTKQY